MSRDQRPQLPRIWFIAVQSSGTDIGEEVHTLNFSSDLTVSLDQANATATVGLVGDPWIVVSKSSNETTQSDDTLSNDSALTFAVSASTKYAFRAVVHINTPAAADFKWSINGPAAPTLVHLHGRADDGSSNLSYFNTAFGTSNAVTSTSTDYVLQIHGIVHNGANSGTVAFQWAQNTSTASDTTVYAGSHIQYRTV